MQWFALAAVAVVVGSCGKGRRAPEAASVATASARAPGALSTAVGPVETTPRKLFADGGFAGAHGADQEDIGEAIGHALKA